MKKKILFSLVAIAAAAAVIIGGTTAFFSDTETSTGNTFTAGAIDLTIDNESYVTNKAGVLVYNEGTSWGLSDLTNQLFFNFLDLKPGDRGEDTISLHVNNNDAWACMNINLTATLENGQTEPEAKQDPTAGANEGELQNELYFAFWADDGDNVYEEGEVIFKEGLASEIFDGQSWTLSDSQENVWLEDGTAPLTGEETYFIAKYWCYGELTPTPVPAGDKNPLEDTGFTCNGQPVTNVSQTDGIEADVSFYAVQSRNNSGFTCDSLNPKFVLTDASEQNALNAVSLDKPWYTQEIDGLCIDFTLHNPTSEPAWFDFQIDANPGSFFAGLSDILITEGPLNGQFVGNLYSSTKLLKGETKTVTKCGNDEIKMGIHFGPEQLWYLDWATFTAQ